MACPAETAITINASSASSARRRSGGAYGRKRRIYLTVTLPVRLYTVALSGGLTCPAPSSGSSLG